MEQSFQSQEAYRQTTIQEEEVVWKVGVWRSEGRGLRAAQGLTYCGWTHVKSLPRHNHCPAWQGPTSVRKLLERVLVQLSAFTYGMSGAIAIKYTLAEHRIFLCLTIPVLELQSSTVNWPPAHGCHISPGFNLPSSKSPIIDIFWGSRLLLKSSVGCVYVTSWMHFRDQLRN